MESRILMVVACLILTACAGRTDIPYNESWSKAKNLTHASGLDSQIYDQQLPASAYSEDKKLFDYKLANIHHPAYGSSSGVAGVNVLPYGPFENFYWGWTIPGASHHNEHRIFAWMPKAMADDEQAAQETLEKLLSRASHAILDEMGFKYTPTKIKFKHEGVAFQQWYLGQEDGDCSLTAMNCVLSLYIPPAMGRTKAPGFSFYSVASEVVWFFDAEDDGQYPRLVLAESGGRKSIRANVFYQKLSARLPGWVYFYMAPS